MELAPKSTRSNASSNSPEPGSEGTPKPVFIGDPLPSVVLECIFKFYKNVDSLKTWRLVSKPWNQVCCRILRKVSAVQLNGEDNGDLENFNLLIKYRDARFPHNWPNAFLNLNIEEASVITAPLVRFVRSPNYKITSLEMVHKEGFDPVAFEGILEQHKEGLVILKIRGDSDSVPFLTLTEKLGGGGWRSLKFLVLTDTCGAPSEPCRHVEFISGLTSSTKLEEIHLAGDLRNVTRVFRNNYHSWEKLNQLQLESDSPPRNLTPEQIHDFMKWAEEINFGPLIHLATSFKDDDEPELTSEEYTPYLLPLIQKSSQTAEDLRVDIVSLRLLPSLPKLKHLSCAMMNGDQIQDITDLKFPSLSSVCFDILWTEVPTYERLQDYHSNKHIVWVTTYWRDPMPTGVTQELLWSMLGDHFPNLKNIFIQQHVSSATLHLIKMRLPGLKLIQLAEMTASDLLGTSFGEAFAAKGWPCQTFANSALLGMNELTHVILGDSVTLSSDVISTCLGKLPKVEYLIFHWNNSLRISDVLTHLGSIKFLAIVYMDKEQKGELEKLTKTMKQLKLVHSEHWEYNV